jgi:hypothetical protein
MWIGGKGGKGFGSVEAHALPVFPSTQQWIGMILAPGEPRPFAAEFNAYLDAMTKSKKTLVEEKRFNCCVGQGGCDECAYEGYCPCGKNLAKDMEAPAGTKKRGVCGTCLDGQHAGHGRLGPIDPNSIALAMGHEEGHTMPGLLGPWTMAREGSGTSWMPSSSPLYGRMMNAGRWQAMSMGTAFLNYTDAGGLRGDSQIFAPTQYMVMARRETGGTIFGLRGMVSADPLLIGGRGYPNLFQTGETYGGLPLKDRQHPHDLFMELAASASTPIGGKGSPNRLFLYFAPVGEPPIGMSAFQHRATAWDNPLAPITHHWFDGTHITYGVATLGATLGERWKAEFSSFTGREPNEDRYGFDRMRLDSYAGRLTMNPGKDLSLQSSYAFLRNPEPLHTGSQHRWTASAQYNSALSNGDNLAILGGFGANIADGQWLPAWLMEAAYTRGRTTWFGRYENVVKNELVAVPAGDHRIGKLSLGGVYNFQATKQVQQGLGGSVEFYSVPSALKPSYGSAPVGLNLFYRLRFGRM